MHNSLVATQVNLTNIKECKKERAFLPEIKKHILVLDRLFTYVAKQSIFNICQ